MPTTLTGRQAAVLKALERHIEEHGYPPSQRELAAALGIRASRAVEKHLAALERKGFLRRESGARALSLAAALRPAPSRQVPIVGQVAAGGPILAEENRAGALVLDATVARWPGCFLLKVKGESMREAGILDGDLVLVEPRPDAESGQIVVALLDGEATVKRLLKRPGAVILQPENPDFEPLRVGPQTRFSILGKVRGVFRY